MCKEIKEKSIAEVRMWLLENIEKFNILMAYYRCAMMEVTTKFQVLDEEMSLRYDRNPIETIKSRLKKPESIADKLSRKNCELTIENIERMMNDVAGIRVICSFPSDIYMLAEALERQDDIIVVDKKDYIKEPKENGYQSLHMIIGVPIFLHDHKKMMTVEVQFRTIAMDLWATLEHKIMYKKKLPYMPEINAALLNCAHSCYYLDKQMEEIYDSATRAKEKLAKQTGEKQ